MKHEIRYRIETEDINEKMCGVCFYNTYEEALLAGRYHNKIIKETNNLIPSNKSYFTIWEDRKKSDDPIIFGRYNK